MREPENMETPEEKVKEYLIEHGISQRYFANLIGISPSNLTAMFQGKRRMKAYELIKFCETYSITLDFFKVNKVAEVCNG